MEIGREPCVTNSCLLVLCGLIQVTDCHPFVTNCTTSFRSFNCSFAEGSDPTHTGNVLVVGRGRGGVWTHIPTLRSKKNNEETTQLSFLSFFPLILSSQR